MTSASGPSPILTQTTGNELDFYLVVKRYNFSMQPALFSPYYRHCEYRWRLVVYPRNNSSGVNVTIECGGPLGRKKLPWSCSARLMVTLVHPQRWKSIGLSFPIQEDDEVSKIIIPRSESPSETSPAAAPTSVANASTDARTGSQSTSSVSITVVDPESSKKSECAPAKLSDPATEAEPAPQAGVNQSAAKKPSGSIPEPAAEAGSAAPVDRLSVLDNQITGEETSKSEAGKTSKPLPTDEGNEAGSDSKTFQSPKLQLEEEEYIPQDLIVTQSHTYSSAEFSYSYTEVEFAPFALLQPGMFCDEGMNIVIRVKILANDSYNANQGNAGSLAGSVYGSSTAAPALEPPPPLTITPLLSSDRSSFVPSCSISEPTARPLQVTCRRALAQQIVDMDKKIASVSSDIAADILKQEIRVLNDALEQLSCQTANTKKGEKKMKDALVALLKHRKRKQERGSN